MCNRFWCILSKDYNCGDPHMCPGENCRDCERQRCLGCKTCGHIYEYEGGCDLMDSKPYNLYPSLNLFYIILPLFKEMNRYINVTRGCFSGRTGHSLILRIINEYLNQIKEIQDVYERRYM